MSIIKLTLKNSNIRSNRPDTYEKSIIKDFCISRNLKLLGYSRKNTFSFFIETPLNNILDIINDSILVLKFDIIS